MGDKLSSLQALPQGHHQLSSKQKQSPILHFTVGLACAARAAWGCSSRQAPVPRARAGNQGNAGGGAAKGDLEVHGSNRCWGVAPDLFKFGPIRMQTIQLDHGKM